MWVGYKHFVRNGTRTRVSLIVNDEKIDCYRKQFCKQFCTLSSPNRWCGSFFLHGEFR